MFRLLTIVVLIVLVLSPVPTPLGRVAAAATEAGSGLYRTTIALANPAARKLTLAWTTR